MSTERCLVTELLTDQCAHCRPAPPAEPFDEPADPFTGPGPWIVAHYPGRCSACGERFEDYSQIRADGQGGYECECARAEES